MFNYHRLNKIYDSYYGRSNTDIASMPVNPRFGNNWYDAGFRLHSNYDIFDDNYFNFHRRISF